MGCSSDRREGNDTDRHRRAPRGIAVRVALVAAGDECVAGFEAVDLASGGQLYYTGLTGEILARSRRVRNTGWPGASRLNGQVSDRRLKIQVGTTVA